MQASNGFAVEQWKPSYSSQFTIELNLLAARTEDR
jgi:hypothetical protein